MKRAKSTRRVMLLARMESPTCRLQTGRPWLSPSSRSLPLTTVHLVLLANTRRPASRSPRVPSKPPPESLHLVIEVHDAGEASQPADDMHEQFDLPRVHVLAIACNVPPAREHEARPRTCVVENSLRCS